MSLQEIGLLAKQYSDSRSLLGQRIQSLNDVIERIKRRRLDGIKSAVEACALAKDKLRAAIEKYSSLFIKPRTQIAHGIKFGYKKGKGKFVIDNEEQTIKLIKKNLPDMAEQLVVSKETVNCEMLKSVSAADLKRIAVRIEGDGDRVTIKGVDTEIDKLISAMLKEKAGSDSDEP